MGNIIIRTDISTYRYKGGAKRTKSNINRHDKETNIQIASRKRDQEEE
jgi:hypothetical protein